MISYSDQELVDTFVAAKNLNAAIKKFLKQESQNDPQTVKFLKGMRKVAGTPNGKAFSLFLSRSRDEHEAYFYVLGRYAHADIVEGILDQIIEQHAEKFNQSYEITDDKLRILDEKEFFARGNAADEMICSGLASHQPLYNNFMRLTILSNLFDPKVLEEILPKLKPLQ